MRFNFNNLEFNFVDAMSDDEGVTLSDRAVAVAEIREQVVFGDVAR